MRPFLLPYSHQSNSKKNILLPWLMPGFLFSGPDNQPPSKPYLSVRGLNPYTQHPDHLSGGERYAYAMEKPT